MHEDNLAEWCLKRVAIVAIDGNRFAITVTDDEAAERTGSIYAFVIDGEIVRVGSSAGLLKKRFRQWERDVSIALAGGRSSTPLDEAARWREALKPGADGAVYARRGTEVTTTVGTFTTHLDEERILIARLKPRLNRSWR
jgi:hypothetical protein